MSGLVYPTVKRSDALTNLSVDEMPVANATSFAMMPEVLHLTAKRSDALTVLDCLMTPQAIRFSAIQANLIKR